MSLKLLQKHELCTQPRNVAPAGVHCADTSSVLDHQAWIYEHDSIEQTLQLTYLQPYSAHRFRLPHSCEAT